MVKGPLRKILLDFVVGPYYVSAMKNQRLPFLLTVTACLSASLSFGANRPNVVLVLVDDLGATDLGCTGSTGYRTPALDAFAKTAVHFTHGYAGGSVCSPSRAAVMTGKHPARVGITDWIPGRGTSKGKLLDTPEDLHALPAEETTLAEALKAVGYKTFYAGKWHLGGEGSLPTDHGFEINKGGHHRGSPPGGYYSPYKNPYLKSGPAGEYLPDRLTDETLSFIRKEKDGPFFAMLAFYTVHTPIQPCKRFEEEDVKAFEKLPKAPPPIEERYAAKTRSRQDNPGLASMVTAMDENVGRLLKELDTLGIADNTVVVFTSDNGGLSTLGRPGPNHNVNMRAGKGWCYEGGIRVPFIVRAPGMKAGHVSETPVVGMDLFPTVLELAGVPLMPKQHADGVSLVPELKGHTIERDAIYWHYPHYHGSNWRPGAAIRMGDWKLVRFYEENEDELFNLATDPAETTNVAQARPKELRALQQRLEAMQKDTGAKIPTPQS